MTTLKEYIESIDSEKLPVPMRGGAVKRKIIKLMSEAYVRGQMDLIETLQAEYHKREEEGSGTWMEESCGWFDAIELCQKKLSVIE